jgi:hypothetical protein
MIWIGVSFEGITAVLAGPWAIVYRPMIHLLHSALIDVYKSPIRYRYLLKATLRAPNRERQQFLIPLLLAGAHVMLQESISTVQTLTLCYVFSLNGYVAILIVWGFLVSSSLNPQLSGTHGSKWSQRFPSFLFDYIDVHYEGRTTSIKECLMILNFGSKSHHPIITQWDISLSALSQVDRETKNRSCMLNDTGWSAI